MGFLLLAAIFLSSTGLLIKASVAPPPAVIAPAPASGSGKGRTTAPQPRPELPGMSAPLP